MILPIKLMMQLLQCWNLVSHGLRSAQNGVFSGPCFPVFGLNTEIYGVNLYFDGVLGHFSRSDICFSQRKLGVFMMIALEC